MNKVLSTKEVNLWYRGNVYWNFDIYFYLQRLIVLKSKECKLLTRFIVREKTNTVKTFKLMNSINEFAICLVHCGRFDNPSNSQTIARIGNVELKRFWTTLPTPRIDEEMFEIHYEFNGIYVPVDIPFKNIYYSQFPRASGPIYS